MLACETYNMTSVRVKVRVTKMERKDEMNRYVVRIMRCSPFVVEISYVMTSGDIRRCRHILFLLHNLRPLSFCPFFDSRMLRKSISAD